MSPYFALANGTGLYADAPSGQLAKLASLRIFAGRKVKNQRF
jgi:hypothetical protein